MGASQSQGTALHPAQGAGWQERQNGVKEQVWGGREPLGSVSRAHEHVGDWTASQVGVLPFWVKWRVNHVSAPTMEDVAYMSAAILEDLVCMGAAMLDNGSCESPAILEVGKVVG